MQLSLDRIERSHRFLSHYVLLCLGSVYFGHYFLKVASGFSVEISKSAPQIVEVPRLSITEFNSYWRILQRHNNTSLTPILITGALSLDRCELLCSNFLNAAQNDETIRVQLLRRTKAKRLRQIKHQRGDQSELISYNVSLLQAIDTMMTHSNHNDSFWCFEEGLLEDHSNSFQTIYNETQSIRQLFLQGSIDATDPNDDNLSKQLTNWFDYFPKWAKSTDCVVLSGCGSTSTLHRDPFEWTGTSICLEGCKIWRFIAPQPNVCRIDDIVRSYRLPSIAWNENTTISAGWQSDFSLYRNLKLEDDVQSTAVSSSTKPTYIEKYSEIRNIANSMKYLVPDKSLNLSNSTTMWTAVQQEGDFLIIPAHYWHQTYSMEPTLTISSQHCSDLDVHHVLNHIKETTGIRDIDIGNILQNDSSRCPREQIQQFFHKLEERLK
jgi:hypothetical protein